MKVTTGVVAFLIPFGLGGALYYPDIWLIWPIGKMSITNPTICRFHILELMSLLFSSFKPLTRRRPPELQLSESLSTYSIPSHPRARPSSAPDARLLSNSANCACLSCQVTMLLCHQWLIVCLHLPLVWVFECLIFELYKCVVLWDNWVVLRRCLVRCSIPLLTNQATLIGIVDHCVLSSCKHIELVSLHDSIIGQVG